MSQEIFKRYEKKYILTMEQYRALSDGLTDSMAADSYGKYTISNIYFDTRDYSLIRRSLEGPEYKEKMRLRSYGTPDDNSTVYAELKKKYQGVIYKRRIPMAMEEARKYLYYGIYPKQDSQILREIDYVVKHFSLRPSAYVAYDRTAFYGIQDSELRVTFDRNIRCRNYGLDLKKGDGGTLILGKDCILMEVKIPGAVPLWMSGVFSDLDIYPVSFSKYGVYYKEYLCKCQMIEGGLYCA